MRRALIVGGSGFVGRQLFAQLGAERAIATRHRTPATGMLRFDARTDCVQTLLAGLPSDVTHVFVPFAVANPERCAEDPIGSARTNVDAVIRTIRGTLDAGRFPIFVSTDYVFDGSRGNRQEDEPQAPSTEYGRQKTAVETWLQGTHAPWLIARLSKVVSGDTTLPGILGPWVGDIRHGRKMRSATDQIFSPSLVDDVARALIDLAASGHGGIYHVAGSEAWSRYDLNRLFVDAIRRVDPTVEAEIEACSLRDIPFREPRPLDTALAVGKLEAVLDWRFRPMAEVCATVAGEHFGRADR